MAIDTEVKRQSAVCRRLPWFRRFLPVPDGTVDQPDRQQAGFVYRGIAAGAPVLPSGQPTRIISIGGHGEATVSIGGRGEATVSVGGMGGSTVNIGGRG